MATGDADWFRATYDAQVSWVWNLARRMGVESRDVADVVQEVFLVVHRQGGKYDPTRPLRPWLFAICFHVADRHKRRAHRRHERLGSEAFDNVRLGIDPEHAYVESMDQRKRREALLQALDTLDAEKRVVFVAHDLEGMSMPDIAALVNAPLNTLYSRLRLARERITQSLRAGTVFAVSMREGS